MGRIRAKLVGRVLSALFAALLLLPAGGPLRADQVVSHPYLGITLIDRRSDTPRPIHTHVAQVDLAAPGIRLTLSPPGGSLEVVRQTTVDFMKAQGAQVATNGHFFWPWPSTDINAEVIGIGASEGRVFSPFESPAQSYALVADAPGINIDRSNRATVVHRDPADATGTRVREPVTLWTTVAGSAQIVTQGVVTIPAYMDDGHPEAVLTPGGPNNYSNERSWYEALNARTAIGISQDGRTLTLFTVDVRGGSAGMTVREVAECLRRDFGVWDALNLDGGGSTSMAMVDPVTGLASLVNTSSDNPTGRAVGSSLAVFARRN